eukprot:scaffold22274_cov145-Isochrysis_galbana.AAC.3
MLCIRSQLEVVSTQSQPGIVSIWVQSGVLYIRPRLSWSISSSFWRGLYSVGPGLLAAHAAASHCDEELDARSRLISERRVQDVGCVKRRARVLPQPVRWRK